MHELSLAASLVETAQKVAKEHNASKVLSVTVAVGVLSGVEKEALTFCFSEVTQGTPLENAELIIETIPIKIKCDSCQEISIPQDFSLNCTYCHATNAHVISGQELQITNLEVE